MNPFKIKIDNDIESTIVQELYFRVGGKWLSDDTSIRHTDEIDIKYLFGDNHMCLTWDDHPDIFWMSGKRELSLKQFIDETEGIIRSRITRNIINNTKSF